MSRLSASRTWLVYRGAESLATAVGWTVTPVFFVQVVGMSPLQLVLAGTALELGYFVFEVPTAHFLRDVGVPSFAGLSSVVWFGVLNAGAVVLAVLVAQPLARHFAHASGRGLAQSLLGFDAMLIAALAVFALAGSFVLAVVAYWTARVAGSLAGPVYSAWLNTNIEDSRIRATVNSITNMSESVGEWGGGPGLGVVGNVYGIRAALAAGAVALTPAVALYGLALRRDGREPMLEALPQAEA